MGFLKRKLAVFCVNWGICKEKMRDFRLNGGIEKTHDIRVQWGILEEKMLGFLVKWGICEEKTRDFRLNVGFEKTRDFCLNGNFVKRKRKFSA